MAGAKVPLTFRIFKGDQFVREERLSLSVIKLGKVPSAHLKLDDETVSRMHAIIEVNGPGDVSIIDLGSTKGTFVNGQKVNKAKLQSGDTIVVGETKIELAIGAGEAIEDAPTRVTAPAPADLVASTPRPAPPMAAAPPAPPTPRPVAQRPPTPQPTTTRRPDRRRRVVRYRARSGARLPSGDGRVGRRLQRRARRRSRGDDR
jgi:pSer/pThr/pTyr-binding forkhead associated (FHA) protein